MTSDIEFKKQLQFVIHDCENMIKYMKPRSDKKNAALWITHWEKNIKYHKLVLLGLNIEEKINIDERPELLHMIATKIKNCLFNQMENLQELVDAGELDENLYLKSVNDLQRLYRSNEKRFI